MAPRQRKDARERPNRRTRRGGLAKLTGAKARTRRQVARLVADHLPLAREIAGVKAARLPPWIVLNDVVSDAVIGLFDAAERFQPGRGVAFRTYAQWRIRGAIDDALRQRDWLNRSQRAAYKRRGADPPAMMSLSTVVARDDAGDAVELGDHLPAGGRGPAEHRLEGEIVREHFQSLCRCLLPRIRLIVTLRYVDDLPMAAIGHIVGLSESRISQILGAAIVRLRRRMTQALPGRQAGPNLTRQTFRRLPTGQAGRQGYAGQAKPEAES